MRIEKLIQSNKRWPKLKDARFCLHFLFFFIYLKRIHKCYIITFFIHSNMSRYFLVKKDYADRCLWSPLVLVFAFFVLTITTFMFDPCDFINYLNLNLNWVSVIVFVNIWFYFFALELLPLAIIYRGRLFVVYNIFGFKLTPTCG